jgi:RNA polymerase sigma factor (sigma-70 family)
MTAQAPNTTAKPPEWSPAWAMHPPGQRWPNENADPGPRARRGVGADCVRDDRVVIDLVTRASHGDERAWGALVERYSPLIWSICRRYRLGDADAEDAVQSVWLRAADQLGAIRDPAALPGWLATVTRRECLRVLRAVPGPLTARHGPDAETIPDEQAWTAEQELLAAERHTALRAAFSDLPPSDRRLIRLLIQDPPVSYTEISAQLGIPIGSIGPTRRRCLDKLRRHPAIAALISADGSGPADRGMAAAIDRPGAGQQHPVCQARPQHPLARAACGRPGQRLPAGAVTFVFSDIEGSTGLVKALRERYPQVLAEHRGLVRAALAARSGREVDTQGDGFFAAFGAATQAVLCALDIQRALAGHRWPGGAQVRVRIGIHTGQAVPAGRAYTGLAVHRAARICAAARGGQVLVSQATQTLIEDEEEGEDLGFTLVDVGEHQLKDLDRPVRLFQLAAAGLDAPCVPGGGQAAGGPGGPGMVQASGEAGPGAEGGAAVVHGWPATLTSFIGRDGPVREVAGLLEERRLVTVTGPGGSGKTRLAGQVAGQVAARFADGAWLVELAPVREAGQVPAVVAAALGVRDLPGVPAAEALARALARRQLLLVLDNCEHVIGAAAELCAGLLTACDDVRILATSREPLAVAGEARYRLAPLALPDLEDLAGAARAEAVALFTDRARSADARFVLDEQTGPAVARVVRRLDGMPLAIELAAAQVEALGVTGLLDRLDDRFVLLTSADRLAPDRQRSLAATVEWSHQLLGEHEQRVFRQMSVFPGPFTLEAAGAVAGAGAEAAVLRLVDCSLLSPPQAGPDGRSRYVLLETLRAYGAGLLARAGEDDAAAAALAGYAVQVAEQAAAELRTGTAEMAAVRWLEAEDAMMWQVLAWAVGHDPAAAVRLTVALGWWWQRRGRLPAPLLHELAGRVEPGSDQWCAVQSWLGWAAVHSSDPAAALGYFTAVRDAAAGRGPSRLLTHALLGRSVTLLNLGRLTEGTEDARRALALAPRAQLSPRRGDGPGATRRGRLECR